MPLHIFSTCIRSTTLVFGVRVPKVTSFQPGCWKYLYHQQGPIICLRFCITLIHTCVNVCAHLFKLMRMPQKWKILRRLIWKMGINKNSKLEILMFIGINLKLLRYFFGFNRSITVIVLIFSRMALFSKKMIDLVILSSFLIWQKHSKIMHFVTKFSLQICLDIWQLIGLAEMSVRNRNWILSFW